MGFSRQEYWHGLPCHLPGDLDPGIKPMSLPSPALAGGFFTTSATWEAQYICIHTHNWIILLYSWKHNIVNQLYFNKKTLGVRLDSSLFLTTHILIYQLCVHVVIQNSTIFLTSVPGAGHINCPLLHGWPNSLPAGLTIWVHHSLHNNQSDPW